MLIKYNKLIPQTTTPWIGPFVVPVALGPTETYNPSVAEIDREMYWDETNRLRTVVDNTQNKMHHYLYDAAGERTLKGSGGVESVYQNGSLVQETAWMGAYKMYPSGFVVLDANGTLTKHYYNGSERIASKLGRQEYLLGATHQMSTEEEIDESTLRTGIATQFLQDIKIENLKFLPNLKKQNQLQSDGARRLEIYYFHPDHLGTSTYLSDANGNPYQFFLNLPFGESMAEQRTGSYNNPYKFNAKELDEETNLYYYGARYYNPQISTWLSVDPLVEQTLEAYSYVGNNPINLVDPTGMSSEDWYQNGNIIKWFDSSASSVIDADGSRWSHFSDGYSNNTYNSELGLVSLGPNGGGDWSLQSNRSVMFDAEGPDTSNQILANINSQISDVANNLQVRNEYIVSESTAKAYEKAYHQWSPSAGGLGNSFAYGGSMLLPEIGMVKGISYLSYSFKLWSATRISSSLPKGINYTDNLYRISHSPSFINSSDDNGLSFLSFGRGTAPVLSPTPMRMGVGYTYGLNSNASAITRWSTATGGTAASQIYIYQHYQKLFQIKN